MRTLILSLLVTVVVYAESTAGADYSAQFVELLKQRQALTAKITALDAEREKVVQQLRKIDEESGKTALSWVDLRPIAFRESDPKHDKPMIDRYNALMEQAGAAKRAGGKMDLWSGFRQDTAMVHLHKREKGQRLPIYLGDTDAP